MARGVKKGVWHASASTKLQIVLAMNEHVNDEIKELIPSIEKATFINIGSESEVVWAAQLEGISLLVRCVEPDVWKAWEIVRVKW